MASTPPITSEPITHVFRLYPGDNQLKEIPRHVWDQIVQHQRPLQPKNATVRLLVLQGQHHGPLAPQENAQQFDRDDSDQRNGNSTSHNTSHNTSYNTSYNTSHSTCHSIDALQLQTDSFGFLLTWDASNAATTGSAKTHLIEDKSIEDRSMENKVVDKIAIANNVIDLRHRFLQRYISHRHIWQPSRLLLAQALVQAGYFTHPAPGTQ